MKLPLLLLLLGATQLLSAQIQFTEVSFPWNAAGSWFGSVAFADIDNDGDQDLLITGLNRSNQPMIKLYTNDQGEFSEVSGTPFEGVAYSSVAFTDVDNDGDQDLFITGLNDANQWIAKLYSNQAGVFSEVSGTPFEGVKPGSFAFADVDNDGDQDLLITGLNDMDQPFAKLYSNLAGTFSEMSGTPFNGVNPGAFAFADVDNDGDQDLLITGQNDANQRIAKLYSNQAGVFSEVSGTPFEGVIYGALAFADVDNDGDQDLLITGQNDANQRIAKLYSNQAGVFSEVSGTPFEGVIYGALAFADVDNDGDQDLLITGQNDSDQPITHLYDNKEGTFEEINGTPFVGVRYGSSAFADVNNDGSPDLFLTGININLEPIAKLYTNVAGVFTEKTATPFEGVGAGAVAFADVDDDGDQDVLITGFAGLFNEHEVISKLYENQQGTFTEVVGIPFEGVYLSSVAFADVDNDRDQDLLITGLNKLDQPIAKLYENQQGTFTELIGTPFEGVAAGAVAFANVDNDGDLDLLITGQNDADQPIAKLYSNQAGTFSEVSGTPFEGVYYSSIAFADVDNDGDLDLLITGLNDMDQPIAKLYSNQAGTFSEVSGTPFVSMWRNSTVFLDIDNDGDSDLLMAGDVGFGGSSSSYEFKLYLNEQGSFSEASYLPFEGGTAPFTVISILSADVDNDGDSDLLVSGFIEPPASEVIVTKLYLNNMGIFSEVSHTPFEGIAEPAAAFADVDGDEDLDLLLTGFNRFLVGNARLYLNEGLISSTNKQEESRRLDFAAFPNPVDGGELFITCRLQTETPPTFQVYNAQGISMIRREFFGMGTSTFSLDVSTLPSGVYFLIGGDGKRYGTLKFLIP